MSCWLIRLFIYYNGKEAILKGENYTLERQAMVELLVSRGIRDTRVLNAMGTVKRHLYFPGAAPHPADPYGDFPWQIGYGQTMSQPYIVAYMLERLALEAGDRVLEIGTGSGYQAAVLGEMGMEVFTMEKVPELCEHSRGVLNASISVRSGDGWDGWPEEAPFRGIILSCAPEVIPGKLFQQLDQGGRMILPLGNLFQRLILVTKNREQMNIQKDLPVRFVPMVGE